MQPQQYNHKLLHKYTNDQPFKTKIDRVSNKFTQYEQLAVYKEYPQTNRVILSVKTNDEQFWSCEKTSRINIEIVIGKAQPTGNKSIENLLLSIIKHFPRPSQPYSLIYINTLADKNAFNDFKKIVDFLPLQYLVLLEKVYVVQASFFSKAFDFSFDYILTYFKNKTVHVQHVQKLLSKIGLKSTVLTKMPKQIGQQLLKGSKIIQQNLQKSLIRKQSNSIPKVLEQYQAGKTGAPLVIQLLIYYFNEHRQLLDVEGLFRKSANIQEETILLKEIQRENYEYLQTLTDPHLVANAIKRFLSNLTHPIIPYQQFNTLMISQDQIPTHINKIINSLPNNRKMTIFLLLQFFQEQLLPRRTYNQMSQESLSIVIGPCLMRSHSPSLKDLAYAPKIVNVMKIMFTDFELIFGNKKKRTSLLRESVWQQEEQGLKQRLGVLRQQYQWLEKVKLTQEQQQNLDEADQFLSAFNKK